ncbi:Tricarboxylate transport protein [Trichoderma lentiforme]|uniref:Tricarboxylate transport protein n=1 Tax=Trichoderma lentiforme TaxID=1567552 RepID=A0A9P4XEP9_9HYPO|nr:Tricarboxylate transport protein [Trichoderma lentiforme]
MSYEAGANIASKRGSTPAISFVSGSFAGGVECLVTYPFEFAKTSMQLQKSPVSSSPLVMIRQLVRTQGVTALYTGCSSLVLGTMLKCGVRFFFFENIKLQLTRVVPSDSVLLHNVLAGMGAGAAESLLAVTPSERIKTALIDDAKTGKKQLRGGLHAVQVIFREQGIRGLFNGLLPTTLKQSMTSAARMGSYSTLKHMGQKYGLENNSLTTFAMGAAAGTFTVYATQPFDSVKTRSQALRSSGTIAAARSIINDYGFRGLWRGSTMRLGRLLLSGGIVFTVYENTREMIEAVLH